MQKKLYRSRRDVILGGVCSGLADYFGIDTAIIRVLFVLFAVAGGPGFLVYLVLWVVIPHEDKASSGPLFEGDELGNRARAMGEEFSQAVRQPDQRALRYLGIGLLLGGLWLFLQTLNLPWLAWMNTNLLWPFALIIIGAVLLTRAFRGE